MRLSPAALFACVIAGLAALPARAQPVDVRYNVTALGGLSLGDIEATVSMGADGYRIGTRSRPHRLARVLGGWQAAERGGRQLGTSEAAMSLGAPPFYAFRTVTLPILRPAITAALIFSFIVSFDEVTVTVFLIGPDAVTLPTRIFTIIQESASPVIAAVSSFLVVLTTIVVLLLQRFGGLSFYVADRSAQRAQAG